MDNSASMMYNGNNQNTGIKQPATLRDITSSWKQKNENALKYAGDSAKKTIDAGLKQASDFMKDADKGTKFENVQTASVKWNLANDSNNKKLSNIAMKEMIGHLSKENKEPYLKDVKPLQTYIDAKDEFDYKNNNYTTTENIDTTPHEGVRSIQRKLNEKGYTDKFGNALKEDGIYGGKTAYALDEFEKNAAKKYGVNPSILASCIYTEQILNVNVVDTLTDNMFYWADTSVGIGQVKVSTAKLLEDKGYINKIP